MSIEKETLNKEELWKFRKHAISAGIRIGIAIVLTFNVGTLIKIWIGTTLNSWEIFFLLVNAVILVIQTCVGFAGSGLKDLQNITERVRLRREKRKKKSENAVV